MTFCGDACVHEHRLRSDPVYMRECVFARDKGVCAVCKVDTVGLLADLLRRPLKERRRLVKTLGYPPHRVRGGTLWDADHIVPVAEGGGECGLENMQTVCVPCHRRKTAVQGHTRRVTAPTDSRNQ